MRKKEKSVPFEGGRRTYVSAFSEIQHRHMHARHRETTMYVVYNSRKHMNYASYTYNNTKNLGVKKIIMTHPKNSLAHENLAPTKCESMITVLFFVPWYEKPVSQ